MTTDAPCRCNLCLAFVHLAESAERNLQAAKAERRMHVVQAEPKRRRKVAA